MAGMLLIYCRMHHITHQLPTLLAYSLSLCFYVIMMYFIPHVLVDTVSATHTEKYVESPTDVV